MMNTPESPPELIIVGHTGPITSLAFSPEGRTLLSGSYDRTVIAWDWQAGTMRRLLTGDGEDGFSAVAFSPDGQRIAGDDSGVPALWDAASGQRLRTRLRGFGPFAFSPDGRTLAGVTFAPQEKGWAIALSSARTGRVKRYVSCGEHPPEEVFLTPDGIAFTADGRAVATVGYAGEPEGEARYAVTIVDVAGGAPTQRLWDSTVQLIGTRAFPGARLVALAPDGARLWDAETGELLRTVHDGGLWSRFDAQGVALSPDGATVAAGNSRGDVWVWGASPERAWAVKGHESWVRALAFSPDGATQATAGDDGPIRLWEVASGNEKGALGLPRISVEAAVFDADGRGLRAVSSDRRARLWNLGTGRLEREIAVGPPGDDVPDNEALRRGLTVHNGYQSEAVFSPDGRRVVTASRAEGAALWDVADGRLVAALDGLHAWARPFAFSADGSMLATDGAPNAIQLWDAAVGRVLRRWELPEEHDEAITLAFSADGQTLASGHSGYTVALWDVRTGRRKRTLYANRDAVSALAFAPDGKTLAVGTAYDDVVWLYGPGRQGRRKRPLRGHTAALCALAYSPDGRWLASGAADSTVRLWDAADGNLALTLRLLPPDDWVAYTPAGDYVCSAGAARFLFRRVNGDLSAASVSAPPFHRNSLDFTEGSASP